MHTSDAHSCLRLWSAISATSPSASVARLTTRPQRALPANVVGRTRPGYVQARHNDLMFSCLWLLAAPVNAPSFRLSCLFCLGRAFAPRAWPCCWAPRRLCLAPRCTYQQKRRRVSRGEEDASTLLPASSFPVVICVAMQLTWIIRIASRACCHRWNGAVPHSDTRYHQEFHGQCVGVVASGRTNRACRDTAPAQTADLRDWHGEVTGV
jgi:hypothetical protein